MNSRFIGDKLLEARYSSSVKCVVCCFSSTLAMFSLLLLRNGVSHCEGFVMRGGKTIIGAQAMIEPTIEKIIALPFVVERLLRRDTHRWWRQRLGEARIPINAHGNWAIAIGSGRGHAVELIAQRDGQRVRRFVEDIDAQRRLVIGVGGGLSFQDR